MANLNKFYEQRPFGEYNFCQSFLCIALIALFLLFKGLQEQGRRQNLQQQQTKRSVLFSDEILPEKVSTEMK